jgi:L-propargylglycine--L-glutamate ligase
LGGYPDGTVEVLATHDQILSSGQYWGCRFPASEKWRGEITRSVDRVGQTLAELGVRGTFGVDFVTSVTDGLLAVEVNLRKVGPSHVLSYVESLVGSSADGHSALQGETSPMHYLHRRVLQPEILCGEQPQVVVDRLRTAGLLTSMTPARVSYFTFSARCSLRICGADEHCHLRRGCDRD